MNLPVVTPDGVAEIAVREYFAVKSPVFPFNKIPRSGHDSRAGDALDRGSHGISKISGQALPSRNSRRGSVCHAKAHFSERPAPRQTALRPLAKELHALGFPLSRHAARLRPSKQRSSRGTRLQSE